ncbi:efflux RND transporter periplasmic adaptor subunit [Saccharicrinis aurantiacus]|uniref:efflux RND transporter periplasmic adaptor subunit n=1 Tax=Saccharicrinis aurantiacus TaxID=1849719 RepID=UPI00248F8582|nr:efflux RND transporter periplasmic adaptor subunit [Saccharicrinis aurantiacus]
MKQIFFIAVQAILVLGFSACSNTNDAKVKKARYVKSYKVLPSSGNKTIVYNGVVSENREVALPFKVGGPVTQLLVDDGEYVERGQTIASIDKRDYKINVQTAKAQFEQIEAEYDRYQKLYNQDKLPANTLDKVKSGYLMAKSQLEAAENALSDTDLRAPFSGYISEKLIENFETVAPGQPIVKLIDVSKLEVIISIPENQINEVEKLENITCDIKNANRFNVPASVKSISKKSGPDRMFEVRLILNDIDGTLVKSGMVAKVSVNFFPKSSNGISVPIEAIFAEGTKSYVWSVNKVNMKVAKKEVVVGDLVGSGFVTIKEGVTINDVVVTAGVYSLQENQEVKILPNKSASNVGGLL